MKISDLQEAIKGWKHAGSDLMKHRAAAYNAKQPAMLVSIKKDGTESKMHDAKSYHASEDAARRKHADIVGLNPGRNIRHNLYVDGKLMGMLDKDTLTEVSYKVGMAAGKALSQTGQITPDEQQKYITKYQALDAKEKQLSAQPDAATGKYAKQFQQIHREKVKVARAGNLNAFGKPLAETASGGATSSGSVASVANPFGIVMRRPSLFGYVKPTKKNHTKSMKNK